MREFKNVNLNPNVLKMANAEKHPLLSEDAVDESMALYNQIMDVFKRNNTDLMTAFLVLSALADSIYAHSVFGEDLD